MRPSFWKTDVDAAYRRVPLSAEHRFAAVIAFVVNGRTVASEHWATPFGGAGAVYSWERVGRFIAHCVRVVLHVAAGRYVDDYFGAEYPECAAHTTECVARLIRAMLGPTAVADRKCESGAQLPVLGLTVEARDDGLFVFPT